MVRTSWWLGVAVLMPVACGTTSTESVVGPDAPKCSVSVTSPDGPIAATGGTGVVTVTTQPECEWTAVAEASWITELAPSRGQGAGQVQFQATSNPAGTTRESAIAVNGQRAVIRQGASACQFTASASVTQFQSAGGSGTIAVSAPVGCAWTAASNVSWISPSPASGSGSASVAFTVAGNGGTARAGTITAGGVAIAISQAGAQGSCAITINPTSQSVAASGANGLNIAVDTAAACAWTATSNAPWLTITSGASGSGDGTVRVNVASNAAAARTGTVTIGGSVFTVNQASAPCNYSINPTSQSIVAAGGTGTAISVSTGSWCTWTASSNASWLTITSAANGTGDGTVNFRAAANTGGARTGTLTVATRTFTVNQAAGCAFSINPTSITVGDENVDGLSVAVTATPGCSWTATSQAGWLDIESGSSGTGNGTVIYDVSDFGGTSRTGTMTIAGQTFTVTQVRCSATITPTTQSVTAPGGSFSVAVTTQIGCGWEASENLTWVTITSGSNGKGNGTASYLVSPNTGAARNGSVSVAGRTLTISQAGP